MCARERLETLDDFLGDACLADCQTPSSFTADLPQQIIVTVRTVAGDAVFGPEPVHRGTPASAVKGRLKAIQTDSLIRLLHGRFELRDDDLIEGGTRSGTLDLSVVYTMEPTEEERQAWQVQLEDGHSLASLPAAARADRQVVLSVVRRRPDEMQHASMELRCDRTFMTAAVRRCGDVLKHAGLELRRDAEVVMAAMEYGVAPLRYADRTLRASRDFMLAAVAVDGQALRYASNEMKHDRQVVHAAIEQDEDALQYAEIEDDPEIDRLRAKQVAIQNQMYRLSKASHETAFMCF